MVRIHPGPSESAASRGIPPGRRRPDREACPERVPKAVPRCAIIIPGVEFFYPGVAARPNPWVYDCAPISVAAAEPAIPEVAMETSGNAVQ